VLSNTRDIWELTEDIIGACIEVHSELGPGLLESAYEDCVCFELNALGLSFERRRVVPVVYKSVRLEQQYELDLVVEKRVIVELKCVAALLPVHEAQLLTYLRLAHVDVGLLINFNSRVLTHNLRRLVRQGASIGHSRQWKEKQNLPP
jgi:GxxExxY protein